MSSITFNEFAKRTILALKELEYDLKSANLDNCEWCAFLQEELEDEEDIEERDFLAELSIIADADREKYENLSIIWEDQE